MKRGPVPLRANKRPPSVSITTVAAEAGVSIATVSRIVNGVANRASAATTARVRAAIEALGYRPVSVGRALRRRSSRLVALLASNIANPAMAAIAAAAEVALREAGYIMVLCDTHDVAALQDEYLLEMRAQLAQATVLLGAVASPVLRQFRAAGEPLLFVNRRCPGERRAPFVGIDNRAAGREVADFFLSRGTPPLALIHGSLTSSATADRIAGFRARLKSEGVVLDPALVTTEDTADHLEIGYRAMKRIFAEGRRPGGLFCTSDLIAYGAAHRARELGLAVPGELLIVGFDDSPLNRWIAPWLSSVRVPYERYGAAIVEALNAMWQEGSPPAITLPHELVTHHAQ
jgi:LacI family transcriptional regulator